MPPGRLPAASKRGLGLGAAGGVLAWVLFKLSLEIWPPPLRFGLALVTFTLGPAALFAGAAMDDLAPFEQGILLAALGVGLSPALADVLARLGLVVLFPYVSAVGVGVFVSRCLAVPRRAIDWHVAGQALVPATIALVTGAIVFGHRLLVDASGISVFGDYDSVDLSYYAGITGELAHRVPPMAPFYAGHPLNYSWYPQLLLALIHRFADVSILEMYFRFAWPALLAIAGAAAFVFIRSIASTTVALLAATLILVGGDFSYLFVWLLHPRTYLFDWLLWPTNFLAPTMEVLHFSTWTPSLPVLFAGLYAVGQIKSADRSAWRLSRWIVIAAVAFALLVQFKPFAYAVLMAALAGTVLFPGATATTRRRLSMVLGLSVALAAPFLYQIVALYAESRSHLKVDYFLLQRTMLDKLALTDTVNRMASRVAAQGSLHTVVVLTLATLLFFVGGLGVRWAGVPGVLRVIGTGDVEEDAPIWRVLAWMVLAGVLIPFVIVTDPYQDTLQFYQTGLFVLWIFAARAIVESTAPSGWRAFAVAASIAAAAPSSVHYLLEKSGDGPNHLLVHASRSEMAVDDYLRGQDPERTVVLHDRPMDPSLTVIEGERRAVLAWRPYVTGSEPRRREVDRFFASADRTPAIALDILRKYNVTHVVEHPGRDRINRDVLGRLRAVLTFPDVVLYEVPPGVQ